MKSYSNTTTERLEGFARARGLDYGILISPDNAAGRYFLVWEGDKVANWWVPLGWTVAEAKESIRHRALSLSH